MVIPLHANLLRSSDLVRTIFWPGSEILPNAILPALAARVASPRMMLTCPRLKELPVGLAIREQFDPLNVVLLLHRVRDGADLDFIATFGLFYYGDMLLRSCISGTFSQKLHGLSATNQLTVSAVENLYNIATRHTFVNLKFVSHNQPLS